MENWENQIKKQNEAHQKAVEKSNDLIKPPIFLSEDEKEVWNEIANVIITSTNYMKTSADVELLQQYCQTKIIRDKAWVEYNKNTERYIRIVTGICQDGKTPKVVIKENEHYKTLVDCNKQLEKLLKDFKLTPDIRSK